MPVLPKQTSQMPTVQGRALSTPQKCERILQTSRSHSREICLPIYSDVYGGLCTGAIQGINNRTQTQSGPGAPCLIGSSTSSWCRQTLSSETIICRPWKLRKDQGSCVVNLPGAGDAMLVSILQCDKQGRCGITKQKANVGLKCHSQDVNLKMLFPLWLCSRATCVLDINVFFKDFYNNYK